MEAVISREPCVSPFTSKILTELADAESTAKHIKAHHPESESCLMAECRAKTLRDVLSILLDAPCYGNEIEALIASHKEKSL